MLCIDFHTHSIASHHATHTLDELLKHADQIGIKGLAVTDHSPDTDNTLFLAQNSMSKADWQDLIRGPDAHYFKVFVDRYQPYHSVNTRLFKGIECNIRGEGEPVVQIPLGLLDRFDVVIASVHPLPNLFVTRDSLHVTERLLMAMDEPVDIIGHPFHKVFTTDVEKVVRTAAQKEIALELNNSSLRLKKAEPDTIRKALMLARQFDCKISLASDAHCAHEVASDDFIRPILQDLSFPDELIVNHSLEAAECFVADRKEIRAERKIQIKNHLHQ